MRRVVLVLCILWFVSPSSSVFYASCSESTTRPCVYGTNATDRLQALKKGGSSVMSTSNYDIDFYPCEQYNYNCGYAENQTDFVTIANGVQLNLTYSELLNCVPGQSSITNRIKPYLSAEASNYSCVGTVFPLLLSDGESITVLSGFLNRLTTNLSTIYATKKTTSASSWANININIKTAILQMAKYGMNTNFTGEILWANFLANNWALMSAELKDRYSSETCPECLHSAYLIDSVTIGCNKYQSINFLVDQSWSVGSSNFQYALTFLQNYVNQTDDDLSITSINFFDSSYDSYIGYGNSRAKILQMLSVKSFRDWGSPAMGNAINNTIAQIAAANFQSGVPKIIVLLTSGWSTDNVYYASVYARSLGIALVCIGVGNGVDNNQLLQMAGTSSNILKISDYYTLTKLPPFLENYLCKQIANVNLNQTLYGNVVRVPASPNYYQVPRSSGSSYYQITITFSADPDTSSSTIWQSHYDPFPDKYSVDPLSQSYRTSTNTILYYISPQKAETIPIKKTLTSTQTPPYSYISIAGYNLSFNISLSLCSTSNCTTERAQAAQLAASYAGNHSNSTQPNIVVSFNQNENNLPNPSVFIGVSFGLAALAAVTFGVIYGVKKFKGPPEEELLNNKPENQQLQQIQQNQIQNVDVPPINQG